MASLPPQAPFNHWAAAGHAANVVGFTNPHFQYMRVVKMEQELGDLIFSLVNVARLYDIDPESALERTNQKFIRRFNYLEEQTLLKGQSLHDLSLAEMDVHWEAAKKLEKKI